jgi:hypothetical protein
MEHRFPSPKFRCPICFSDHFGTSRCSGPDMTRHCHRCDFSAPADDDWKLFQIPGVRPFANRGEYDLVMDIIRSVPLAARRVELGS